LPDIEETQLVQLGDVGSQLTYTAVQAFALMKDPRVRRIAPATL
jgi:hypothetical protein